MAEPADGSENGEPDAAAQIAGLGVGVILLGADGRIARANPAAEELLGCSAARLIGEFLPGLPQATRADHAVVARDIRLRQGRGVTMLSNPLHDHSGWRVVTLFEAGSSALEAAEAKALGAPAILSHEIKNPLAAIRGAGQLLARRVQTRDAHLVEIIGHETERIAGLVDRMEQLGRTAPVLVRPCNLHQAVRIALRRLHSARGSALPVSERFDPSLPMVQADDEALQQVLLNLLENALDSCANVESPSVIVRTRYASGVYGTQSGGTPIRLPVELSVLDNGPGVPEALRDHIFEPFVTSKPNGQGLGLPLVRKLVRDMGGRITHERDEIAELTAFRVNFAVAVP